MTKRAFDAIAAGLEEAVAIAQGRAQPAKLHVPDDLNIKAIRGRLPMSQEEFAATFGFSITQIRDWEQGRSRPLRSDRAYLMLIDSDPELIIRALSNIRKSQPRPKKVA